MLLRYGGEARINPAECLPYAQERAVFSDGMKHHSKIKSERGRVGKRVKYRGAPDN